MTVQRTILIEDLVSAVPSSVTYLMNQGIKCIACGDPIWGTLEQAAQEKGFSDEQIDRFVSDLAALAAQSGESTS